MQQKTDDRKTMQQSKTKLKNKLTKIHEKIENKTDFILFKIDFYYLPQTIDKLINFILD